MKTFFTSFFLLFVLSFLPFGQKIQTPSAVQAAPAKITNLTTTQWISGIGKSDPIYQEKVKELNGLLELNEAQCRVRYQVLKEEAQQEPRPLSVFAWAYAWYLLAQYRTEIVSEEWKNPPWDAYFLYLENKEVFVGLVQMEPQLNYEYLRLFYNFQCVMSYIPEHEQPAGFKKMSMLQLKEIGLELLKKDPRDAEVLRSLESVLDYDNRDLAMDLAKRSIEIAPNDYRPYLSLGYRYSAIAEDTAKLTEQQKYQELSYQLFDKVQQLVPTEYKADIDDVIKSEKKLMQEWRIELTSASTVRPK